MNIIWVMKKITFIIVQTVIVHQAWVIKHFAINGEIKDYIVSQLKEKNTIFL